MMIGQGAIANVGQRYYLAGRSLAGADASSLEAMKAKYGDGPVKDKDEMHDIMSTLVYPLFTDKDWQWCTINCWLDGTPSEDELSWKARYFSEMPRLEEICGDHAYGNQFDAAFDEFKSKGASDAVIAWMRGKRKTGKAAIAEKEGEAGVQKGLKDAKTSVNPFENPWIVGGIAAAVTLILFIRLKK